MKRITIRVPDEVHASIEAELVEWRKVRGPRFSLNDLCILKLWQATPVTTWQETITAGTNTVTVVHANAWTVPPKEKHGKRKSKK